MAPRTDVRRSNQEEIASTDNACAHRNSPARTVTLAFKRPCVSTLLYMLLEFGDPATKRAALRLANWPVRGAKNCW